jgi:transposase-like protein
LRKGREALLAFYDFPAEHWIHLRTTNPIEHWIHLRTTNRIERWIHLRTTNPIESTFATVRLRHRRKRGSGSRAACLAMVFKLCESAAKRWRLLNGAKLLPDVIAGAKFINGEKPEKTAA